MPLEEIKEKITEHGFCRYAQEDDTILSEMDISESEISSFIKSFFFYYQDYKMILSMEMINPEMVESIGNAIKGVFRNVGKTLMPKLIFAI